MTTTIAAYSTERSREWNALVNEARAPHFMFLRSYMDYHSDRFIDASLLAFQNGRLMGLLPASRIGNVVTSHGGLTFGGWITRPAGTIGQMMRMMDAALDHFRALAVTQVIYKPAPSIYAEQASDEALYSIFRVGGRLVRRDLGSAVNLAAPLRTDDGRRNNLTRARKSNVSVRVSADFESFYPILSGALDAHGAKPVHSVAELRLLQQRHTANIRLLGAFAADRMLAGAVVFDTGRVVHTQYLASSAEGRQCGALDAVIEFLKCNSPGRQYLSFGISTEQGGRKLNEGLAQYKEGFGGRAVLHDHYEIDL